MIPPCGIGTRSVSIYNAATMDHQAEQEPSLDRMVLGIAGVGLIGGSIAAAARARMVCSRIIGFGRSAERLRTAQRAGLIDDFSTDYELCRDVDFFVSCLPVDRIAESVRAAGARMSPGSVLTDAGSTKRGLCEGIGVSPSPGTTFVGSHPLAGSERQGFEHADANLFDGRVCVITPSGAESPEAVTRVAEFWAKLGSRVVSLSAAEHDKILARTSHTPHIAAAALASIARGDDLPLAAGGFRDTTRIAAGDPALWTSILLANRAAVEATLDLFLRQCEMFREALQDDDANRLQALLADAKSRRDAFDDL